MAYKNQKKNKAHNKELRKIKNKKPSKTSGMNRYQKDMKMATLGMYLSAMNKTM